MVTKKSDRIKSLRFKRLYLENWRNFLKVDIALDQRTFLVGPNASGKSNLLDIFRFLHDIASVGGGLQESVHGRGGISSLRALAARRYSDIIIRACVGNGANSDQWEYELHFNQNNLRRPIIKLERVAKNGRNVLERPDKNDAEDPERLTQTAIEQVNVNREFRELVDFFTSVRYLHIVPQLVRDPGRSVGHKHDPYGGDFLELIASTVGKTQNARFGKIRQALRVAVPQLAEIELKRDDKGTPHIRGKYKNWRPRGVWQTEEQFSDGTLRLLGLLWAILDGSGPLLLEEPELSLHPEVIRYLPQMFAKIQRKTGRQIILSTHSVDLLRDTGIGMDEIFVLQPTDEGTSLAAVKDFREVEPLLRVGGINIADIVLTKTRPEKAEQLMLFGD